MGSDELKTQLAELIGNGLASDIEIAADAVIEQLESNYSRAITLLRSILFESGIENDFDAEVYEFLQDVGEVRENDVCYLDADFDDD